jgi:DNA-binding NarL/FixJ family response regulator
MDRRAAGSNRRAGEWAMTISVFLLDVHELVRTGLKTVFESEVDIEVVGEAASAAEALVRIPQARPDVAILDVRLPDGQGVEVCREIRSTVEPAPACLMLTSYSDDDALFGAIMAGAAGYMLKQVSGRSLVDAVRTVAVGGSLLDATLTASVMNKLRGETAGSAPDPRYEQLSPQERRVLDLVAEGLTNRQIAERLFLAEKTVKNYVSSVLHKLGVERRTSAAVYVSQRRAEGGRST